MQPGRGGIHIRPDTLRQDKGVVRKMLGEVRQVSAIQINLADHQMPAQDIPAEQMVPNQSGWRRATSFRICPEWCFHAPPR